MRGNLAFMGAKLAFAQGDGLSSIKKALLFQLSPSRGAMKQENRPFFSSSKQFSDVLIDNVS